MVLEVRDLPDGAHGGVIPFFKKNRSALGGREGCAETLLIFTFHQCGGNQWEYLMLLLDDCLIFALSHV